MDTAEATREKRLRRMAKRQGLEVRRVRRFDPLAVDYGKYAVIDPYANAAVFGLDHRGMPSADLDEIEDFLSRPRP